MYRTDKQFMKNPATASSRVYIGALNKTILPDDLEGKFKAHGNILGLVLNSGFAFIQYEHDYEAQAAIKAENGAYMQGRKIIVKQAIADNKVGGGPPQGGPPQQQQQQRGPPMRQPGPPPQAQQSIKPLMEAPGPPSIQQNKQLPQTPPAPSVQKGPPPPLIKKSDQKDSKLAFIPPDQDQDVPMDEEMDTGPNIRPPPPQNFSDDRRRTRGNRGGRNRTRSNDRFDDGPGGYPDRPPFFNRGPRGGGGDFMHPPDVYGPPHIDGPPPLPDRNDCEIIVVSRTLTEYAEYVENRLKQLGLIVDLLFPNEDIPIGRVLANISSRGCLFAILVMPQNEEHRSVTLNILHGISQEHRNMPIDDALLLMSRNFEAYMRGQNLQPEDPTKMSLNDRHPTPMQMLFNLLAENRQLSTSQYDRVIKYLEERRDLQHEFEIAEGINQDSSESTTKQTELQNRIMNILNKSDEPVIPQSITAPTPTTKESTPTPLLKDPTVQKALDSLLTGDMFKNIAGAM